MYSLKPFYSEDIHVGVPNSMYTLRSIYGSDESTADTSYSQSEQQSWVQSKEVADSDMLSNLQQRQDDILKRLHDLKAHISTIAQRSGVTLGSEAGGKSTHTMPSSANRQTSSGKQPSVVMDLVVTADPESPPLSLVSLCKQLKQQRTLLSRMYSHSSVTHELLESVKDTFGQISSGEPTMSRAQHDISLTFIWKKDGSGTSLMVNPNTQSYIQGEANVARYIARLISPAYDSGDAVVATMIDQWLDASSQLQNGNSKEQASVMKAMNSRLGKSDWLVGSEKSLADVVMLSAMQYSDQEQKAPANVKKWVTACKNTS